MSNAKLIDDNRSPRTKFKVEIKIDSEREALGVAQLLKDMHDAIFRGESILGKVRTEIGCCYTWAEDLAKIIENK